MQNALQQPSVADLQSSLSPAVVSAVPPAEALSLVIPAVRDPTGRAAIAHPREPVHVYRPRQPEQSILRRAVREHLDAFLRRCAVAERPVPATSRP